MLVYRITTVEWSDKLTASGFPARWNGRGRFVLYTQSSMTLAYLENVVHRSGEGLHELFKIMIIEVPDDLEIHELKLKDLPPNWDNYTSYSTTQSIGNKWIANLETPILKVPSAIIPQENNYLFNLAHPDYYRLKLLKTEPFAFDLWVNESDSSIPHSKIDSDRKFPLHDYRFDVAVSFAGEDRVYVERIVANLKVNNIKVFYDKDYQAELWGKDLYQHLGITQKINSKN